MASLFRKIIVALGTIVSFLQLLCAMGLLSSIIIWLSLEFEPGIPSALAFVVGIPCLCCTVIAVLMFGIPQRANVLTLVYILLSLFVIFAGLAILGPFVVLYSNTQPERIGDICDDCDHIGNRTQTCVDACHDECCFINYSAPLSRVFIILAAVALGVSVAGVTVGMLYICSIIRSPPSAKKKTKF